MERSIPRDHGCIRVRAIESVPTVTPPSSQQLDRAAFFGGLGILGLVLALEIVDRAGMTRPRETAWTILALAALGIAFSAAVWASGNRADAGRWKIGRAHV